MVGRNLPLWLGLGLLVVVLCAIIIAPSYKFWRADLLTDRALEEYSEGTLDKAKAALKAQVEYIESHHRGLGARRDTNSLLLVSHAKLAYMGAFEGDTNSALSNLSAAYFYHGLSRANGGKTPIPATNFVQFLLSGVEQVDSKSGASWKKGSALSTNSVEVLGKMFAEWERAIRVKSQYGTNEAQIRHGE
jgi:hypothetical protein